MKRNLLLSLFLGLICMAAMAQSKAEKEVLNQVEIWRKAVLGQDIKTLDAVFAPDLTYGHSNGHIDTKESFINTIENKKEVYNELELTDMTVKVVGNTAMIRHKMTGNVRLEDGTISKPNLGVLQVWTKKPKGWQLLARQAFKLM